LNVLKQSAIGDRSLESELAKFGFSLDKFHNALVTQNDVQPIPFGSLSSTASSSEARLELATSPPAGIFFGSFSDPAYLGKSELGLYYSTDLACL
jgi:hypothetical protein